MRGPVLVFDFIRTRFNNEKFNIATEGYLESSRTSTVELFCENS